MRRGAVFWKAFMGSYSASAQRLVDTMTAAALADPARGLAFQGAPGANSDLAAREFDPQALPLPCYSFEDAIEAVRDGRVDRAIIPIENSLHGRVQTAGMADHVGIGEIHDDQVMRLAAQTVQRGIQHAFSAHLGLQVIGCHLR